MGTRPRMGIIARCLADLTSWIFPPPSIVVRYLSANEHVQFVSKIIYIKNTIIDTCACSQNIYQKLLDMYLEEMKRKEQNMTVL